jgi:trimethylamine:corrinoid methyltransferase-like protein
MIETGGRVLGYARALLVDVGVDDEALALNEIDAVGPGGSHLGRGYTRRRHRETWAPRLFDRATHDRWAAAGATTLKERVAARTQELRDEPRSFALEQTIRDRLQAVLAEVEGSSR